MNEYLIKAMEAYPYDLAAAWEYMAYAMAYDEEEARVHLLYARFYVEQLNDNAKGVHHFELAMLYAPELIEVYIRYIDTLLVMENMGKAKALINKAEKLAGICKACLYSQEAFIEERSENYEKAIQLLNKAIKWSTNNDEISHLKEQRERVMEKNVADTNYSLYGNVSISLP